MNRLLEAFYQTRGNPVKKKKPSLSLDELKLDFPFTLKQTMFPHFKEKKQTVVKFCIQTCLQECEPINLLGGRNRVGTKRSAIRMKPAGHVESPAISGDKTQPQCACRNGFGAVLACRAIGLGVLGNDFHRRWRHWFVLKENKGEMRRE